jgi:hypothetical protein
MGDKLSAKYEPGSVWMGYVTDTTPDPEVDFDGCLGSLTQKVFDRREGGRRAQTEWYIRQSASRLFLMRNLGAPARMLDREKRLLLDRIADLPSCYVDDSQREARE